MKSKIVYLLLILFFSSCEGPYPISLIVVDKITQRPLDSVFVQIKETRGGVENKTSRVEIFTDSTGAIEEQLMAGTGLSSKKINFTIYCNKKGYQQSINENKTNGVIELVK
jgi:hypothetical protein